MKKTTFVLSFFLIGGLCAKQQFRPAPTAAPSASATKDEKKQSTDIVFNPESSVVTQHEITIKGQRVPIKATAGTLPVWDEDGKTLAGLFYTYYERTDVRDRDSRPIIVSFNGGPGSASVWMHIAYTGPVVLNIDDEGYQYSLMV
jgi:carboxypeptidase C (cathepsin A)